MQTSGIKSTVKSLKHFGCKFEIPRYSMVSIKHPFLLLTHPALGFPPKVTIKRPGCNNWQKVGGCTAKKVTKNNVIFVISFSHTVRTSL